MFGAVEGGFEFRPVREDLTWDLSRVFERISRDRIASIDDLGAGRLFIGVGCDCHADAFFLRDGQVVLDIKDGPPPAALAVFNSPLPDASLTEARGQNETISVASREREIISDRGGLPLVPSMTQGVTETVGAPQSVAPSSETFDVAPLRQPNPRVAETEAALVEQLARAVSQGLVVADTVQIDNAARPAGTNAPMPLPLRPVLPPPPPPVASPRGHVSVETGVDRAAPDIQQVTATDAGNACLAPTLFEISEWGGSLEQGADLGRYRSRLLGEFDQAESAAVADLAHYYLYLSFGAETKALLRQFPESVERADLLFQMADVMDTGKAEGAGRLIPQMACDGATALWATLAQLHLKKGQSINTQAVTLAFT
ncbi:MAG TPA: hypothetical protein ENK63_01465, partial [Rhodobacterales bacterium]|nr:hypothetical protein [Rhodobacterales bacterium]